MSILPTEPKDRKYMLMGLRIISDFGASIAVPVVLFVIIGQWLDNKYEKGPLFTVIAFLLAALVSGKIIYKKSKQYGKEYNDLDKK
jgi:F0F1-type ATP synthase assembly protein I